jgi:uncharacterized membrane protein
VLPGAAPHTVEARAGSVAEAFRKESRLLVLIIGLLVFLGMHSVRVFADDWRSARISTIGANRWRGLYSLASLVGFGLIVWGYSMARATPVVLWNAPGWSRHAAALLVLVAFVLVAAAYSPPNHFKAALGHPMLVGTKVWAFAHLLANGTLADLLLFGSFLVWAVMAFGNARARDRRAGVSYPAGTMKGTVISVVAGSLVWILFAFYLHRALIGVQPLG